MPITVSIQPGTTTLVTKDGVTRWIRTPKFCDSWTAEDLWADSKPLVRFVEEYVILECEGERRRCVRDDKSTDYGLMFEKGTPL